MTDRRLVLLRIGLEPYLLEELQAKYDVIDGRVDLTRVLLGRDAARIEAVITNGSTGFQRDAIENLTHLKVICCLGAGFENVDLSAARERNIVVTRGSGTNAETVADHALALMLAVARGIITRDRAVRVGEWEKFRDVRPALYGGRLGILGLGNIGSAIARRGAAFGMRIHYHNRRPRPDVPWSFEPSVEALADAADFLVASCPGGAETRHIVNEGVFRALGPHGFFVNVARGSVADTDALIAALKTGAIAGAALDVVEGEPNPPCALLDLENVVLTPHMAGRSTQAVRAQFDAMLENLETSLNGQKPVTPVS